MLVTEWAGEAEVMEPAGRPDGVRDGHGTGPVRPGGADGRVVHKDGLDTQGQESSHICRQGFE